MPSQLCVCVCAYVLYWHCVCVQSCVCLCTHTCTQSCLWLYFTMLYITDFCIYIYIYGYLRVAFLIYFLFLKLWIALSLWRRPINSLLLSYLGNKHLVMQTFFRGEIWRGEVLVLGDTFFIGFRCLLLYIDGFQYWNTCLQLSVDVLSNTIPACMPQLGNICYLYY